MAKSCGDEDAEKRAIAQRLFEPGDKNPYLFNGKPLKNLSDLKDYLIAFTGKEAIWVAAWLEYLGDKELAVRIRKKPQDFKRLILKRYDELKRYA